MQIYVYINTYIYTQMCVHALNAIVAMAQYSQHLREIMALLFLP